MHYQHAQSLLELVRLSDMESVLAGTLACGAQRRLEVARALATNPQLLLLDEPLAGMNPVEVDEFVDLLPSINRLGVSILLIEHNVQAVMRSCDPIYVIDYGKIIAWGTPSELLSNDVVVKAYLGETARGFIGLNLMKRRGPKLTRDNEYVSSQ